MASGLGLRLGFLELRLGLMGRVGVRVISLWLGLGWSFRARLMSKWYGYQLTGRVGVIG